MMSSALVTLGRAGEALWRALRHPQSVNVGLLVGAQYAAGGISFLTAIVSARLLHPGEYGLAALVMAFPTLLWSFTGLKSVSVTTRFITNYRAAGQTDELRHVTTLGYLLDLITAAAAVLLVWISADRVAASLGMAQTAWLSRAFALSFLMLSLSSTSLAVLSALGEFRWLAGLQAVGPVITLVVVTVLLLLGFGAGGMVIGTAAGQIAVGATMTVVATVLLHRDGQGLWWQASWTGLRRHWQALRGLFGWNYAFVSLTGLMGQIPLLVLGRLRGPAEAGFYGLASSLAVAGSYLETGLGRVSHPTLAVRWDAGERRSLAGALQRWTVGAGLPGAALILLAIPILPLVIPLIFGEAYAPVAPGAQVMMVGVAAGVLFFWLTPLYYSGGPLAVWTLGYAAYTAVVIGAGVPLVHRWGFLGLAALVSAGRVLFVLAMAWHTRRFLRRERD